MPANNSSPLVSIIMPTYNRAGLIRETINSIRDQSYQNWELLIVDDGSDDNTKEIIAQLTDKRVQFIEGERTGKPGKMRNKGIALAKGELIAFMDSDDLWDPSKIEKQVEAMTRFPEAGYCVTGGYNFREQKKPLEFFYKQKEGWRYDDLLIPLFRSEVAATTPSLLFRRMFHTPFDFANDIEYFVSIISKVKGVILYEPLLFRRLHDSNDSTVNWERNYELGIEMIRSYRERLPPAETRNAFFKLYIDYGVKSTRYRKWGKAIRKFFKAWTCKPYSIVPLKKSVKTILYSLKRK